MISKKELILSLFNKFPQKTFSVKDIITELTIPISKIHIRKILYKKYSQNKIFRSTTQTTQGYIYSKSKSAINKEYNKFILPYDIKNSKRILNKLKQTKFDTQKKHNKKGEISSTETMLVAFVMGDGHIRLNKSEIQFYFKEKRDAQQFKKDLAQTYKKLKITIRKGDFCYYCSVCSKKLAIKLTNLGAPTGKKVSKEFLIPKHIMHGNTEIKRIFLSTSIGNEGSKPQDTRWRIQFVLSKEEQYIENLIDLLNQIREPLYQFTITTTHIQLRKQAKRNYCGRFYIKGIKNIHKFYNTFQFLYASEKQEVLESLIKDSLKCNSAMSE